MLCGMPRMNNNIVGDMFKNSKRGGSICARFLCRKVQFLYFVIEERGFVGKLDVQYSIWSDVCNKCLGCKVYGK